MQRMSGTIALAVSIGFVVSSSAACEGAPSEPTALPTTTAAAPGLGAGETGVLLSATAASGDACHDPITAQIPFAMTIDAGYALRNDGKGAYVDGIDSAWVWSQRASNLYTNRSGRQVRSLSLDLSRPVPGSGGVSRGLVQDGQGEFHAFYRLDRSTNTVYSVYDIPVGATVSSERLEIKVHVGSGLNKKLNLLLLGSPNYPFGYCTAGAQQLDASGSTLARITRQSPTSWTVVAEPTSIGRLFEQSASGAWTNKGLYSVSLSVRMSQK